MELLQGVQYFYTSNGQQVGPVDGTQLIGLAQAGQVTATDHIWAEGFTDWVPVTSVDQMAPLFQAPAPAPAAAAPAPPTGYHPKTAPAAAAAQPQAPGGKRMVKRKIDVRPKRRYLQESSFGKLMIFLGLMLGSIGIAGFVEEVLKPRGNVPAIVASGTVDIVLFLIFFGSGLVYTILTITYLWRAWNYIQELPVARTTPGKAVGFLFIPLFSIYWFFVAYIGWAYDYNKYLDMAEADTAPRASPGLFITFCVLAFFIGPLLHPLVMWEICRGTNYIAASPKPEVPEYAA